MRMETCVVCNEQTSKYKCPKCFMRYCSVSCCKAHKESCQQTPTVSRSEPPKASQTQTSDVPMHPLWTEGDEDAVPEEFLNRLRDDEELRSDLRNPHLRAMMENLVNFDNPSLDMAKAMQEPIFCEFADKCLKVVDTEKQQIKLRVSEGDPVP